MVRLLRVDNRRGVMIEKCTKDGWMEHEEKNDDREWMLDRRIRSGQGTNCENSIKIN